MISTSYYVFVNTSECQQHVSAD